MFNLAMKMENTGHNSLYMNDVATHGLECTAKSAIPIKHKGVGDRTKNTSERTKRKIALRALVASDTYAVSQQLKSAMESNGYKVTVAQNSLEALHAMQLSEAFDIILLDTRSSILTSVDTAVQIRSVFGEKGSVPLAALTEELHPRDHARLLEAGFDEIFTKPITPAPLLQMCKRAIVHHLHTKLDASTENTFDATWGVKKCVSRN